MADTPTMPEALRRVMDTWQSQIRTALPGRVVTYNRTVQTADVRPEVWADGEEAPIIPIVPVVWPRGGSGYLVFPLAAGDTGLIICCESDLAQWRRTGEATSPADEARHHLQNAVFVPGLVPVGHALGAPVNASVLSADDVRLGDESATEAVIGGDALRAALNIWLPLVQAAIVAGGGSDITVPNANLLLAIDAALSPSVKVEV